MNLIRKIRKVIARWLPLGRRYCVLCEHRVGQFLPYRGGSKRLPKLMRALHLVGSDVDHFGCPRCGAHDRERHLFLYLEAKGLFSEMSGKSVLHFAPEGQLSEIIARAQPAKYVKCDLYPRSSDIIPMDILEMDVESASFDLVIANHVLEHVADDHKALSEIHRVLKVGGYAILQTPYSAKLHTTWTDNGICDDVTRLQTYGQEDHVRLYGRDIFSRITSTGLKSYVQGHSELLHEFDANRYGINPDEPFFLFRRMC